VVLLAILYAVAAFADGEIRTPLPPSSPRINGPSIYGVHPGHPFLYRIPATGKRPIRFSATGLPIGLKLDPATGIISGSVKIRGTYSARLHARNSLGTAERILRIVAGDRLALTPTMGWSTWYMAYADISDQMVRAQAAALVSSGLADHGYSFINIDDGWNHKAGPQARDGQGAIQPNEKFPDMKAMTDYLHSRGLKAGIYISPGLKTCAGYEGSYQHESQDAQSFAAWGFDFLKYDLCSYQDLLKDRNSTEELKKPYALMGSLLAGLDRDFIYNLCEYGLGEVWTWGRDVGGNFWRTTDDVGADDARTLWQAMEGYGFGEAGKERWAGPGGWNDPDNILVGKILWKGKLQAAPISPDEQYTWVTLWSILDAPMVIASDLTALDPFTLGLLTNDEVLSVNQDALGKQAVRVSQHDGLEVWLKEMEDGSKVVGFFNRGSTGAEISASWSDISVLGTQTVRDLWRQKDIGTYDGAFRIQVAGHGAELIKIVSKKMRITAQRKRFRN
jgi:alpha-galactosidase